MTDMRHPAAQAPETKAFAPSDEFGALNRLVAEYRSENDERLAELERKSGADPLRDEKIARMDRALDFCMEKIGAFEVKSRRPALGFGTGESGLSSVALEHKGAFDAYMRSGEAHRLQRLEMKSTMTTTAPDGGYLLPQHVEEAVLARIAGLSPIRSIANVQSISGASLRKAVAASGSQTGWTADTAPSNSVASTAFSNLDFPTGELFSQPAATQTMLDDAAVDIEAWISAEIERAFAAEESAAFVNGNGTNKPKGFLTYPNVANASWNWGNLGFVASGAAGAFAASNPFGCTGGPRPQPEDGLSSERRFRDEPEDTGRHPQDEGCAGQLPLAAAERAGRPRNPDELPARRGRGHAGYRGELALDRFRRFRKGLCGGGPDRHPHLA
jgi:predicted phage gp36 major capsid-like protein